MKDVAGAVGIHHAVCRHFQGRENTLRTALVIPDEAMLAERHATDSTPARAQVLEHLARREMHLFTQALGHHCYIDESEQVVRVRAQPAAIKRGEYPSFPASFRVMNCRIGLVSIDVEGAAAFKIERREWMHVAIIATSHDGPLPALRHDERQRGLFDFTMMNRDAVLRR